MKEKYVVVQGDCNGSGEGDYHQVSSFNSFKEADMCLYEIFDDISLIDKKPNGFLETIILVDEYDDNDVFINDYVAKCVKYKY